MSEAVRVDEIRPWLGLLPFREEHRGYFFGRDAEVEEIVRRIRENTLTVLYGQSGLGKSSLLGAGVLPRLRETGFQPAYVRLDHLPGAPPLLEQTRAAFCKVLPEGAWPADAEEISLWELFHRVPEITGGAPPPVLVFDQFEEIFTLGKQLPERAGEAREWIAQMADLLQNRPPEELEARFAENRKLARGYSFSPVPVKVLFALREDFLSHLETWKTSLPLLTQNRMALAPLNGSQALEAVLGPASLGASRLTTRDVAALIVRTVARTTDDAPLAGIRAVPPLLSLLCEQLNEARLASGAVEIADSLVREQSADILQRFYEESFTPFPAKERESIRRIIEDPPMVTEGGFRNSLVREDAEAALARDGVADPAGVFDALVQRRLITAEERDGLRRLEITHDVLLALVIRSRKERRERADAERRRKERKRMAGILGAMLVLLAVFASLAAWALKQSAAAKQAAARAEASEARAKEGQAQAEQQKELALTSRRKAEEILTYLQYDLRAQLSGIGRSDIVSGVQGKVEEYFKDFEIDPSDLPSLRERGTAFSNSGKDAETRGDYAAAEELYQRDLEISRKLVAADPANNDWKRILSASLNRLSVVRMRRADHAGALIAAEEALALSRELAAIDPGDRKRRDDLATMLTTIGEVFYSKGDYQTAETHYREALRISQDVMKNAPGDSGAEWNVGICLNHLGNALEKQNRLDEATEMFAADLDIGKRMLATDPLNTKWQRDTATSFKRMAQMYLQQGKKKEALAMMGEALATNRRLALTDPGNLLWQNDYQYSLANTGELMAAMGDYPGATALFREAVEFVAKRVTANPTDASLQWDLGSFSTRLGDSLLNEGNDRDALASYRADLGIRRKLAGADPAATGAARSLAVSLNRNGSALLRLEKPEEAAPLFDEAVAICRKLLEKEPEEQLRRSDLAFSLIRRGYAAEAGKDAAKARTSFTEAADILRGGPRDAAMEEWLKELETKSASR